MNKGLYIFIFLISGIAGRAQELRDDIFMLPDSVKPFTIEHFYRLILLHHPVARQAELLSEVSRQELRLAKGNFDPKLEVQYLLKHYNSKEYYRLFDGSLKAHTPSPLTPKVGLERNTGMYLNPENYIAADDDYQQLYMGLTMAFGQGLMTDERRTLLQQAALFKDLMEAEQVKIINKLLLDAAKDYWQWYFSYYNYRVATNTAGIASEIFRRTKANFDGGEIAPVDTIQAKITLLERQVDQQEAFTEWKNSTLKLSTYLWDSLINPLDVPADFVPVAERDVTVLPETTLEALVNQAKANHPELRKLDIKLEQLRLDRRLATEFLKPKIDVTYYMLNQPFSPSGANNAFSIQDNHKLGIDFAFPLFLRKESAKLAQTKLKITNTRLDRDLTTRNIINTINTAYNQLLNDGIVLQQQYNMVDNYYRLMNAELLNLQNGESDLFKINIQQEKLFKAQSKLIKVMADYQKQKATLYWAAGVRALP